MAKQSHVPKFGNWDGDDNVPYTAYFDTARKDKARGVMINPNDPEQNPEAFMFGGGRDENSVFHAFQVPLSNNTEMTDKHQVEGKNLGNQRNDTDHHKNMTSMASETSSDKSISDHSSQPPNHRRTRSDRKTSMSDVNSFCPPSPGPNRVWNGQNPYDDLSYRSASVPMFGQWDETDPKSGEGFTVIFNKVKEEKHIAASKFPTVPAPASNYTNTMPNDARSKRYCCLFF